MGSKGYVLLWKVIHENGQVEICRPSKLEQIQKTSKLVAGVDYEPYKWGSYADTQKWAELEQQGIDLTNE